jgi:hypothetical protein
MNMKQELQKLRKYKYIENIIWFVAFPLIFIVSYLVPELIFEIYVLIVAVSIIFSTTRSLSCRCPKCHKYFHGPSMLMGNTLRRTCAHCGLHVSGNNA